VASGQGVVIIGPVITAPNTQIQYRAHDREYELAVKIVQRQKRLEEDRKIFDTTWDDIDDYLFPRRAVYDLGQKKGRDRGDKVGEKIFDGTAGSAGLDLADGFQGYSASSAIKWWTAKIRNKVGNRDYSIRKWLDEVEDLQSTEMAQSNFYNELNECYVDAVFYCTATMAAPVWLPSKQKLSYQTMHPREIFLARDWQGQINLYHRKFPMTGRQIIEEFGTEKLSPQILKNIDTNPYNRYQVIHAIYEREERDTESQTATNMPIASVWVMENEKIVLRESGFHDWPLFTWCWRLSSMETYGRGPGIDTIWDAIVANQAMKTLLETGQMALKPPLIANEELKTRIKLVAGGITWRENPSQMVARLFEPSPNYPVGADVVQKLRDELRDKFKEKTFALLTQLTMMTQRMNLLQTAEIQGEKAALMGPMMSRNQTDLLIPIINATWWKLREVGRIPPPPPSIVRYMSSPIDLEFLGPIAIAQKRFLQSQGLNPALDRMAQLRQAYPEWAQMLGDHVDPDKLEDWIWETYGAPASVQRDPQLIAQVRAQRMKEMQQQKQISLAKELASGYKNVREAPEEGSPGQQLMGGG
jgi:hypothetical protein